MAGILIGTETDRVAGCSPVSDSCGLDEVPGLVDPCSGERGFWMFDGAGDRESERGAVKTDGKCCPGKITSRDS